MARASYQRCCAVAEFFPLFYRNLFRVAPEIQAMFRQTDFRRQHLLLQHAVGLLLAFPTHPDDGHAILKRVAERHSRRDLDVPRQLYPRFVDALVETVAECDPEYTDDAGNAWRAAIAPGIAFMQGRY